MDERRVVAAEPADVIETTSTVDAGPGDTVVERRPASTVVEERPVSRTVVTDDPVGSAYAASNLIQTVVYSIVVLVLLFVLLWVLHVYLGLF
jgi:hypothetical protein